jgi:hypothetical protein
LKDQWADGYYTAAFDTEMIAKNAAATGAASILKDILDISIDDLWSEE